MHGELQSFEVKADLSEMDFKSKAKVYVEAYHRTDSKRFDFGTVEKPEKPDETRVQEFGYDQEIQFRLLVVDEEEEFKKILGIADKIKAENNDIDSEKGSKSILPVSFRDLGRQVWKLEYGEAGGAPGLVINRSIPMIEQIAKTDPSFIMYVYPTVVKELFNKIIFVDGIDAIDDIDDDWKVEWLEFARNLVGNSELPEFLENKGQDFEEKEIWINEVVSAFCDNRKEWGEFLKRLEEGI